MATLIPGYNTCVGRMTSGEKRFAQRLESKLEEDYLCWYDVPIGSGNVHPDFIVVHPRRGLLILEVKDWKTDTMQSMTRTDATLLTAGGIKRVANPMEQARQYAHAVLKTLESDAQLVFGNGRMQGKLLFPWSYGVVLANISRKVFDESGIQETMESGRVICQDEMTESVDAECFQQRLWEMFPVRFSGAMSLPQLDRIRWHLFPDIRLTTPSSDLFSGADKTETLQIPDLIRVMDLQQEQLARSLGEGHRVIHGVAGSGKTLILGYRAEHLAKVLVKPILVLCYNKSLADKLTQLIKSKGISDKVNVRTFHSWCRSQLVAFNVGVPPQGDMGIGELMAAFVERVIHATDRGQIPGGQYGAVLIDEGHDFRPEWLKLIVQMVDPDTNALLVLYDDAQSIYPTGEKKQFSFKSVGIQAQGRTTILKVNYRNTQEILSFAADFAKAFLTASDVEEDHVPRLVPVSAGRKGIAPVVIKLPTLAEEGAWIAKKLVEAHAAGTPWHDMAVLYRHYDPVCKSILAEFRHRGIPASWKDQVRFSGTQDTVRVLPFHSSKGLEFPFVVIPGAGMMASSDAANEDEARLLYVAMTRAMEQLLLTGSTDRQSIAAPQT